MMAKLYAKRAFDVTGRQRAWENGPVVTGPA